MKHSPIIMNPRNPVVQKTEQRSIAIHDEPHSLPFEAIDRTVYSKTKEEKSKLALLQTEFVGTIEWIEQYGRRLGHVGVANQKRYEKGITPKQTTRSYFRKLKKEATKTFFDSLTLN